MSQKGLANALKAVIMGVAVCGLVIYFYFLPVWGRAIIEQAPAYEKCYVPWMVFLWVTAVPCYLVLVCGWKISTEIGADRSFSAQNARLLKYISALAAFDSVFLFVGSGVFFVLGLSHGGMLLLCIVVVFAGMTVTVAAAALSHLVYRAAELEEENELTI